MAGLSSTSAAPGSDKREAPRHRVLLTGKIVTADGAFTHNCAIRDLSDTGAKLRLSASVPTGDTFFLIEVRSGIAYRAHVAWREGDDFGVAFSGQIDLAEPSADPQDRMLHRIWIEASPRYG